MTDADLTAFATIAEKSCGEPGRVLKAVAKYMRSRRPGVVTHECRLPDGATLRRACQIIRTIEMESGVPITGREIRDGRLEARREAMRKLRALGLSTPWIARLLDLQSHATVVMALAEMETANAS